MKDNKGYFEHQIPKRRNTEAVSRQKNYSKYAWEREGFDEKGAPRQSESNCNRSISYSLPKMRILDPLSWFKNPKNKKAFLTRQMCYAPVQEAAFCRSARSFVADSMFRLTVSFSFYFVSNSVRLRCSPTSGIADHSWKLLRWFIVWQKNKTFNHISVTVIPVAENNWLTTSDHSISLEQLILQWVKLQRADQDTTSRLFPKPSYPSLFAPSSTFLGHGNIFFLRKFLIHSSTKLSHSSFFRHFRATFLIKSSHFLNSSPYHNSITDQSIPLSSFTAALFSNSLQYGTGSSTPHHISSSSYLYRSSRYCVLLSVITHLVANVT